MKQYGKNRFLEMIPALLIWITILTSIILSLTSPIIAIGFIIVFDLYWMYRVLYFVVFVVEAWKEHRLAEKADWMMLLKNEVPDWDKYYHVIFLPTLREPVEIIDATMKQLKNATYPAKKMIVVLAGEERDHEQFQKNSALIKKKYHDAFAHLLITEHPMDLPDEMPGKGSNLNYSGKEVKKFIDKLGIAYEDIIASSFDVDTVVHRQYFSHLTYTYATVEDPTRASYQPVIVFNNNIWESPAPVRISAFGTTFWLFGELARPERLWTFSSHSMPFKMLVDVGFWQKDIVSEDSRIYLQAAKRYKGDYRVVPLYLPVSMDAVTGNGYWGSMKALYKQQRRWAWGVEHFPYLVEEFWRDKTISFKVRFKLLWNHVEGMFTWATAPILIFVLGWLPIQIAKSNPDAIVHNAPFTLEWIMRVAALGILFSGLLSFSLLPPRPKHVKKYTWLVLFLQWLLLPVTFIVFGAFPAIDAQTRMALGKYLGFNVTKKTR